MRVKVYLRSAPQYPPLVSEELDNGTRTDQDLASLYDSIIKFPVADYFNFRDIDGNSISVHPDDISYVTIIEVPERIKNSA